MRRLAAAPHGRSIRIELDGEEIPAVENEPVAVSLLAAGHTVFSRSIKYHRPRGPFCLEGSCGQCLMRVDGAPNVFSCRVAARPGLRLERQNAFPSATWDLFAGVDFFFPRGLDHHRLLAGVPIAEEIMSKVARQLAGLGKLPDQPAPSLPPLQLRRTRVAMVGYGSSGAAAAEVLAERGIDFLVCEREPDPSLPLGALPGARVLRGATALGIYQDAGGRFLAALQSGLDTDRPPRLMKIHAELFLLANGGHPSLVPFGDNDAPGVFAGTAALRLLRHGVRVGDRPALIGRGAALQTVHRRLVQVGARPALVLELGQTPAPGVTAETLHGEPLEVHGDGSVHALSYRTASGEEHRVDCDAVVVCLPAAPSFELARQAGARVSYAAELGGFRVETDAQGRTSVAGVWAMGTLVGAQEPESSRASGLRTARAIGEARG